MEKINTTLKTVRSIRSRRETGKEPTWFCGLKKETVCILVHTHWSDYLVSENSLIIINKSFYKNMSPAFTIQHSVKTKGKLHNDQSLEEILGGFGSFIDKDCWRVQAKDNHHHTPSYTEL